MGVFYSCRIGCPTLAIIVSMYVFLSVLFLFFLITLLVSLVFCMSNSTQLIYTCISSWYPTWRVSSEMFSKVLSSDLRSEVVFQDIRAGHCFVTVRTYACCYASMFSPEKKRPQAHRLMYVSGSFSEKIPVIKVVLC